MFALFDEEVPVDERQRMATALDRTPEPVQWNPGKPTFPGVLTPNPTLDAFVGPRSWLLFKLLRQQGNWLGQPVVQWHADPEYESIRSFLKDLKVVNDCAERSIKDMQEYRLVAKDSDIRDNILQIVDSYRHVFHNLRKDALARLNLDN